MRFGLQPTSLIDYPGKLSCVVFVPGCDLRCPYCHNAGLVELDADGGTSLVDEGDLWYFLQKRRPVLEAVVVSGGEASLWKGLGAFISRLKDMDYLVKLDSNGLHPERIEGMPLDFMSIDLKTKPEFYASRIPGSPADAPRLLAESLASARRLGGFEIRTTLAPGIVGIEDITAIAGSLKGDESWILQRFRPGKTLDPAWKERKPYTEAEHSAMLGEAKKYCAAARLR